jgi:hypothetical protein
MQADKIVSGHESFVASTEAKQPRASRLDRRTELGHRRSEAPREPHECGARRRNRPEVEVDDALEIVEKSMSEIPGQSLCALPGTQPVKCAQTVLSIQLGIAPM